MFVLLLNEKKYKQEAGRCNSVATVIRPLCLLPTINTKFFEKKSTRIVSHNAGAQRCTSLETIMSTALSPGAGEVEDVFAQFLHMLFSRNFRRIFSRHNDGDQMRGVTGFPSFSLCGSSAKALSGGLPHCPRHSHASISLECTGS